MSNRPKPVVLGPLYPNAGIAVAFQKRLDALVDAMHRSIVYWLRARYRANPPLLASDELPSRALQDQMQQLSHHWQRKFNTASSELADYFALEMAKRTDAALKGILKRAGMTVEFRMTRPMRDALNASIQEQVGLIRTIPQQHLGHVQQLVMRSINEGHDIGTLTQALYKRYDITKKRAALIARDQNSKATATFTRVRYAGMGIKRSKWMHSHAGKEPRPDHVAFSEGRYDGENPGPFFNMQEGVVLDHGKTWPGIEINCRCTCRPVLEALGE